MGPKDHDKDCSSVCHNVIIIIISGRISNPCRAGSNRVVF